MQQAKLYYQDEAGFHLLVSRQATWAPVGQTPILQAPTHSPHLSVSVAIRPEGELFYQLRESSFKGNGIVQFLKKFLHGKKKKVFLLWDSARIHTGHAVKGFLSSLKKELIYLYHTPKYAPATNAAEQVWHYIKNVELANCVYKTIQELKKAVKDALEKLKTKPQLIQRFFHHVQVAFYN
jgi:transposase